jgi:hypothetical protein
MTALLPHPLTHPPSHCLLPNRRQAALIAVGVVLGPVAVFAALALAK